MPSFQSVEFKLATTISRSLVINVEQGTLRADVRYSFTASFLHAAAIFVRRAYGIESEVRDAVDGDRIAEHRGYVVAAVMQSVAALEAEIYEITVHGPGHHLGSNRLDADARDFLAPLAAMIDDQEVLERYVAVLHLLRKEPLARDGSLWENVSLLVRLRNALVHYKSRWGSEIDTTKLLASLRKLKLQRPPFISEHEFFFPNQCLSAACAGWAVSTSLSFLLEFYSRLGLPAPVSHLESKVLSLVTPPQ